MKNQLSVIALFAILAISSSFEIEGMDEMPSFDPVIGSLKGFYSGLYDTLGLGNLTDLMGCYSTTNGGVEMAFYYQWASVVNKANISYCNNATWFYFNSTGAYLYLSLPTSLINCVHHSNDYNRLASKVGIDPQLTIVLDAFQAYMTNNATEYHAAFASIYQNLNNLNSYAAGQAYGGFVWNVTQLAIQMENNSSDDFDY